MKVLVCLFGLFILVLGGLVAYFEYTPQPTGIVPKVKEITESIHPDISIENLQKFQLASLYLHDLEGKYKNPKKSYVILRGIIKDTEPGSKAYNLALNNLLQFYYWNDGEPDKSFRQTLNPFFMYSLFQQYLEIKGIKNEYRKEALEAAQELKKYDIKQASYHLGNMYLSWRYRMLNPVKGKEYYKKAAELGHEEAAEWLENYYK